jgi:hypothetical protein
MPEVGASVTPREASGMEEELSQYHEEETAKQSCFTSVLIVLL